MDEDHQMVGIAMLLERWGRLGDEPSLPGHRGHLAEHLDFLLPSRPALHEQHG